MPKYGNPVFYSYIMNNKSRIEKCNIGGKGEVLTSSFLRGVIPMKRTFKINFVKVLSAFLIVFILSAQVSINDVYARSSGGGKMGKFSAGKFAAGVGIGLASMAVGNAISSGINSVAAGGDFFSGVAATATNPAVAGFSGSISSWGNIGTWMVSYNSMAALTQLNSGIGMMGQQQGWGSGATILISSIAGGAIGGILNPSATLGLDSPSIAQSPALSIPNFTFSNCMKAAGVGVITGTVQGGINAALADSDGNVAPWAGALAGLAGSFVGSIASSAIAPVIGSKSTGFAKAGSFGEAVRYGAISAFQSIPSHAIGMGVGYITKDMDRQNAFMVNQAFRGVYPVAGSVWGNTVPNPFTNGMNVRTNIGTIPGGAGSGGLPPVTNPSIQQRPTPSIGVIPGSI